MQFNRRSLATGAAVVALGAAATGTALAQSDTQPAESVEDETDGAQQDDADDSVEDDDSVESDDDSSEEDEQVTDPATREQAEAAALDAAGGEGTVTEVEVADEGDSGYEVEVSLADGSFVEVALTDDFAVVSVEQDDD